MRLVDATASEADGVALLPAQFVDVEEDAHKTRRRKICMLVLLVSTNVLVNWAYKLLNALYAVSKSSGAHASLRAATDISPAEFADLGSAATVVSVVCMGIGGCLATGSHAGRTAALGLWTIVTGCVVSACARDATVLGCGVILVALGYGLYFTPCYTLAFELSRSVAPEHAVFVMSVFKAAKSAGEALATLSILPCETQLGWRGVWVTVAAAAAAAALAVMSTSEAVENDSEEATFRSKEADEAEPRCAGLGAAWSWARGGTFFGPALLAASCVGAAVLMEAEWWMTFSLKRYPWYTDEYALISAFVLSIGVGVGFQLCAGAIADAIVRATDARGPNMLLLPSVALVVGAFAKLAAVESKRFYLTMLTYGIGMCCDTFHEPMLYVALQTVAPRCVRKIVFGGFFMVFFSVAAGVALLISNAGWTVRREMYVSVLLQGAGAITYSAVAVVLYPAAVARAEEHKRAHGGGQ